MPKLKIFMKKKKILNAKAAPSAFLLQEKGPHEKLQVFEIVTSKAVWTQKLRQENFKATDEIGSAMAPLHVF